VQYHQSFPDKKLLHVESDILLFPGLPLEKFLLIDKLAWLRVDYERDVAALIYSPSGIHAKFLEDEMLNVLINSKYTTDMHVLFQIRDKNPDQVEVLPSLGLESQLMAAENAHLDNETIGQLKANHSLFEGVFDPVALGIWLTGTDPRNSYGVTMYGATKFILENGSFVNPAAGQYTYSAGRGLILKTMGTNVRIWSLHIHSKDMRIFADSWEGYLDELVSKTKKKKGYKKRSAKVLLGLLRQNSRNKTLIRYTASHPLFRPLMSILRKIKTNNPQFN
jgi:hypothetical protein